MANKNPLALTNAQETELEKLDLDNLDNLHPSLKSLIEDTYDEVDEVATEAKIQTQLNDAGFIGTVEDFKAKKRLKEFGIRGSDIRNERRRLNLGLSIEEVLPEIDETPIVVQKSVINEAKLKDSMIALLIKKVKKLEKAVKDLQKV